MKLEKEEKNLALEDFYDILSDRTRIHLLKCLYEKGEIREHEAVENISKSLLEDEDSDYFLQELEKVEETVEKSLHHQHLSKMENYGLIEIYETDQDRILIYDVPENYQDILEESFEFFYWN